MPTTSRILHPRVAAVEAWRGDPVPGWRGPFRPATYLLALTARAGADRIELIDERREARLAPGTWFFCAPGCARREHMPSPLRCRGCLWMTWSGGPPRGPAGARRWAIIADPEQSLAVSLRRIHQLQEAGGAGERRLAAAYAQTVVGEIELAARASDGDERRPWRLVSATRPSHELLAQVDALVAPRLDDPPDVAELAEALAMSPSSLMHRFRRECGTSLVQRIRFLRMREGRRLLGSGAAVGDAARQLGYSISAFSTVFRQECGLSPSAYRERGEPRQSGLAGPE